MGLGGMSDARHVTGTQVTETAFGSLRSSVVLTDNGKPVEPTDEFKHVLSGICWCQPLVETDLVTGDHLFTHRSSIDSPHIERDS